VKKSTTIRLAGFVGALCASGALLGTAISGTGAYFTDSHPGSINAGTGKIAVTVDPADGQLNFDNLLPGEYQTKTINYTANPVGGTEDIWLVFPGDVTSEAFTGNPDDGHGGGLGAYGHFALDSTGGAHFTSFNLNNPRPTDHTSATCPIDAATGWGGSNDAKANPSDTHLVPYCAPADAILLQSNMNPGDAGSADLTFGYTPLLHGPQGAARSALVAYKIVATQHGIAPNDPNN
jgi:hypothetical protein